MHTRQSRRFFVLGALVVGVGAYTHHTHRTIEGELKQVKEDLEAVRKDLNKTEQKI